MSSIETEVQLSQLARNPLFIDALEDGIGEYGGFTGAPDEKELRLRAPICDLASAAVAGYLRHLGYETQLLMSNSEGLDHYEVDHVMVCVEDTIVDPTYLQFLYCAGLDYQYVRQTGVNGFPEEKIATFNINNPDHMIESLVAAAVNFTDKTDGTLGRKDYFADYQIDDLGVDGLRAVLGTIWNPANHSLHVLSPDIRNAGSDISRFIVEQLPSLDV